MPRYPTLTPAEVDRLDALIRESKGSPTREQLEQVARELDRSVIGLRLYVGRRARALGFLERTPRVRRRRAQEEVEEAPRRRLSSRSAANLARRMVEIGRNLEILLERRAVLDREIAALRTEFAEARARLESLAPTEDKATKPQEAGQQSFETAV